MRATRHRCGPSCWPGTGERPCHQPEPALALRRGPPRCRLSTPRWSTSSLTALERRTGRPPATWPVSWAGCLWRWPRPPRMVKPLATASPITWRRSGSGGQRREVSASPSGPAKPQQPRGRWRSSGWSSPSQVLLACCGCWLSARQKKSRCACCCSPAGAALGQLSREVVPRLMPLLEDPPAANDAVDRAAAVFADHLAPRTNLVSVHQLVQAATADQMPAELASAWRQAAAAVTRGRDTPGKGAAGYVAHFRCAAAARAGGPVLPTVTAWHGSPHYLGFSGSQRGRPGTLQAKYTSARVQSLGPGAPGHPDRPG